MGRSSVHVIRHLTDEPFFIQCAGGLVDDDGTQIATITAINDISLEKRETEKPETWSEAVAIANFDDLQIIDDPTSSFSADMIGGLISIGDETPTPAAGENYYIVAHCTITLIAAYGSGTAKRDFVRKAKIPASLETAPAS